MIHCVNCGNIIEDDCEFCYYCGLDPKEKGVGETIYIDEDKMEEIEEAQEVQSSSFDYSVHGANPLYELKGNRGRRLTVYPHKCVIKTGVTLGSIVTQNATDGEKTIYLKDVIGVQFKQPGLTIGYLQLETASPKGNNKASNFFDENTFTFDNYDEVYEVYKYIISRLDEIKMI